MPKRLALWLIRIYQRQLSPRKGYGCAYRAATGRSGCSGLAYRAIRRHGLRRGGSRGSACCVAQLRPERRRRGGGRPVIASRRAGRSA
ncbi:membrane protein insertion efficiency factor YidD [Chromobacterium vaccinii]|nr:membrane protein insertion efficiency factor YidD [Chromobacterium vaccinii]MBX9358828.1 membrane protein insertion efficiency factor YidD [Chromobacterium vaccinii]